MGYVGAPGAEVRFMDDVHGREVTGGSFPAEIWAKFMRVATEGVDTGSFKEPGAFPGRELNPELELPTSSTSSTSSSIDHHGGATTRRPPRDPDATTTSSTDPTASTTTTVRPDDVDDARSDRQLTSSPALTSWWG